MNKVHGKKPNQLVLDYKISHLDIIPTPSKLTVDQVFKKYIRRYNTYAKKGIILWIKLEYYHLRKVIMNLPIFVKGL